MALLYSPPAQSPRKILRALLYDLAKHKGSVDIEVQYEAAKEDDTWRIVVNGCKIRYDEAEATIIIQETDDGASAPNVTYNYVDAINHIFSENATKHWHIRIVDGKTLLASYANPIIKAHTQWIYWISEVHRIWKRGKGQNDLSIVAQFENGGRSQGPTLCITTGSCTIQHTQTQIFGDLFDVTISAGQTRRMVCPETYNSLTNACKACFIY